MGKLPPNHDILSSIPKRHIKVVRNDPAKLSSKLHMHTVRHTHTMHSHTQTQTHTHNDKWNKKIKGILSHYTLTRKLYSQANKYSRKQFVNSSKKLNKNYIWSSKSALRYMSAESENIWPHRIYS